MPIFGAKSRAMRGCASKLACGRRIDPAERNVFTVIFGKFATAQRADVGIGPYNHTSRYIRIRRKLPGKPLPSAGGQSRPPLRELRKNCAESNSSGLFQLESDVVAVELEETIRTQQA